MANAELIRRLEWELELTSDNIKRAKERILEAAEQLAFRADRAIDDATELVQGKSSSLSWIDRAASDIEEARRAENEYRTLVIKRDMLASLLKTAQGE